MKIAIISSAAEEMPDTIPAIITELITLISKIPYVEILTGGSSGIPGLIVKEVKKLGIKTIAYSPDENSNNHHERLDNLPTHYFDEIKYFSGFTLRSLEMIKDADCVLMLNGRVGTLSEFTIALEEGKKVGVITGTGGIADHVQYILAIARKEFPDQTYFSQNPKEVIEWLSKLNNYYATDKNK